MESMCGVEETEPLVNGAEVPSHPATTTSRRVTARLAVKDAEDGTKLTAGINRNELMLLMAGERILSHLYRYCILNNRIYHTRNSVIIEVKCEPIDEPVV